MRKKLYMAKILLFLALSLQHSLELGKCINSTVYSVLMFYKVVWMQQMWRLPNPRQDTRRPDFPRFLSAQRIALALKQLRIVLNLPAFENKDVIADFLNYDLMHK